MVAEMVNLQLLYRLYNLRGNEVYLIRYSRKSFKCIQEHCR